MDGRAIYDASENSLHDGDRMVIYTDGIIECRNVRGEMFGERSSLCASG